MQLINACAEGIRCSTLLTHMQAISIAHQQQRGDLMVDNYDLLQFQSDASCRPDAAQVNDAKLPERCKKLIVKLVSGGRQRDLASGKCQVPSGV